MCYHVDTSYSQKEVMRIYNAGFEVADYTPNDFLSGFMHEKVPLILDETPDLITTANWGLIPHWAKDKEIRKQTLNAKIETLKSKPAFKTSHNRRCLVIVKGFYEWKWLDTKGREKHRHYLTVKNQTLFALGGIYGHWTNPETGDDVRTFSIVTTEANELMAEIHNTKRRMPVVLFKSKENAWLRGGDLEEFAFPNHESELAAINLDYRPTLFD